MTTDRETLKNILIQELEKKPRTFSELMEYFEPERVSTHYLGEALQELTTDGKTIRQIEGQRLLYYLPTSLEERITARATVALRNFHDALKGERWAEVSVTEPAYAETGPYTMSVFLVKKSFDRKKSWQEERYDDWKLLKGHWARKDEEVVLHLFLTNGDVDRFELSGEFRRPSGQAIAVPEPYQVSYVDNVFYNLRSLSKRTQRLTSFSTTLATLGRGRAKVTEDLVGYVASLDIKDVPPAYRAAISPMIRHFETERQWKKIGVERYMARHLAEHIPYMKHVIQDLSKGTLQNQISPA